MTARPRDFTIALRLGALVVLSVAGLVTLGGLAYQAVEQGKVGGHLYSVVADTHELRLTGVDAQVSAAHAGAVAARVLDEHDPDIVLALLAQLRYASGRVDTSLTRLLAAIPEVGARNMLLAAQRTWHEVDDLNAHVFEAKVHKREPPAAMRQAHEEMGRRFSDQLDRAVSLLAMRADDAEREVIGTVTRRLRVVVFLGAALALGVVGLSLLITRSVTKPLRRLVDVCERARTGDLSARMGLMRSDELGRVSLAFDGMMAELGRSQTELTQAEARYRSLVSHLPDLTWTARADRTSTYVSANIERLLGYTVEEFHANPTAIWPGRVHHEDAPAMLAAYDALFDEGRPFELEYRMQRKDGAWIWVLGRSLAPYEQSGTRYAGGTVTDITLRKRMERLLTESERRYRLLAENMSDFIWTCDLEQRPTYVSPSVTTLTGISVDEVMEKGFGAILTPASLALSRRALEVALTTPAPTDRSHARLRARAMELEHVRRDGSTVWTEVRASFLLDEHGQRAGIVGVTRDISERKKIDRMREDFVSFSMHQLRTPLAGIKWMLELADQSGELPAETRSYVDDARASADRLIGLVNALLATARLEHGHVNVNSAPIDLAAVTHDVLKDVEPLVENGRLHVSVEVGADVGLIDSDPVLLRQVVMNLVGNAIKFTPPDGSIRIRLARETAGVRWEVRDSGIGIPKAEQDRLFQKFYRAESSLTVAPEGTGLGLYMVSLIVKLVGGTVGFEADEGQGSMFFFTIPATPGERP